MVWEQEVSVIVMLTRLNENGNQMCHCYWPTSVAAAGAAGELTQPPSGGPPNGKPAAGCGSPPPQQQLPPPPPPPPAGSGRRSSVTSVISGSAASLGKPIPQPIVAGAEPNDHAALYFGSPAGSAKFEVRLISEHVSSADYLVRNMYLINRTTGETRTVSQFHYLAWLEGRTPENVRSFLQFRRKVHKSYRNSGSPILVHCSDGAGRSGTYTLIDMILERIKNGAKEIDLRATLEHLRDQRPGLCSNQSQFEFALVALAEEIQIILNALPQ
jgi:protein tyrosine phosphatase